MGVDRARGKRALAADVWRLMAECCMGQFGQASEVLQGLGLTPGHVKLLLKLDEGEGRPMSSLAQTFRCDASTMTWLVDRLEERGMVERRQSPGDRRVKAVALTPRGARTRAKVMERMYEAPDELLLLDRATLDELKDALTKIRETNTQPAEPEREARAGA